MNRSDSHALAQAVHDLGAAVWFGGTVMGAVGVNRAGRDLTEGIDRIRVAKSAWGRFSFLQWTGIAATMLAGLQLTRTSAERLAAQQTFGTVGAAKAGVVALGALATAYSAFCGAKIASLAEEAHDQQKRVEVADATTPTPQTPPEIARWQRRQQIAQFITPILAGANIAGGSYLVQSYRPGATAKGFMGRFRRS